MSFDSMLQQAVLFELNWQPSIDAAHIAVTADAGIINLAGSVETFAQKHAAQAAASRIKGVKGVVEELEVHLSAGVHRDDDQIAAAINDRLMWDVAIPPDSVRVQVEKGRVTLVGELEWRYQVDLVEQHVRQLAGVVALANHIIITPRVSVSNVSDEIMHALHRSWFFDPRTITVAVEAGKIRLTGTVQTQQDRKLAAETAWAVPGVTAVENDIVVV